jgi:hypothetical protein
MSDYLKKNARNKIVLLENEDEDGEEGQVGDAQEDDGEDNQVPSSGTRGKQAKRKFAQAAIKCFLVSGPVKPQTQKVCMSVGSMLHKTPEEVVG